MFVHHIQIPNIYLYKPQVKIANQRIDDDHQIKHAACGPALGWVGDSFHAQPRERLPSKRLGQESPPSAPLTNPSPEWLQNQSQYPLPPLFCLTDIIPKLSRVRGTDISPGIFINSRAPYLLPLHWDV